MTALLVRPSSFFAAQFETKTAVDRAGTARNMQSVTTSHLLRPEMFYTDFCFPPILFAPPSISCPALLPSTNQSISLIRIREISARSISSDARTHLSFHPHRSETVLS